MLKSVDTIFDEALKLNEADRAAYLARVCTTDPQLRDEVESLLRAYARGAYLEAFQNELSDSLAHALTLPQTVGLVGTTIDRYRLMEKLGEGGMGVVYVAEQRQPVRRLVALKLIKPGMDSSQVVSRFEAERQALALMNHPHIATVLDAGTTVQGSPYFVMELVRGEPITKFCDRHKLNLRERLDLFIKVCGAVQHAHHKGVIHRDLKPSNILVELEDVRAAPKVIDFGVAKATTLSLTENTAYTGFSQMLGTPLYMSPEQAELNSLDVDTRSDVYSLGVLLYELITGTLPFDKETFRSAGFDEMRRIIREVEPQRPSDRITTVDAALQSTIVERLEMDQRQLQRALRGELDWVVMKTLEKDRNRRYESAGALAADLERFLRNEPVEACPPTPGYRLGKFIHRFRVPIAVSTAFLIALVLGLAIALWQARDAHIARQVADKRLAAELAANQQTQIQRLKAEQNLNLALKSVDSLLDHVAEEKLLNEPHMDALRKRLLKDALTFCKTLANEVSDDPEVKLRTAQASRRLAQVHRRLGELAQSAAISREAIALLESLGGQPAVASRINYESALAYKELAACEDEQLHCDEAEKLYRKVIEICRETLRRSPADDAFKEELALALRGLANLKSNNLNQAFADAIVICQEAIDLLEEIHHARPDDSKLHSQLAAERHNLAHGMFEQGALAEAETLLRKAINEQEVAVKATSLPWQREYLGNHYFLLGKVLTQSSRLADAADSLEQSLEIRAKLKNDHPGVPTYHWSVVEASTELAFTRTFQGDSIKALASANQALAECEDLASKYPSYLIHLANALDCAASIEANFKLDLQRAQSLFERSISIHRELHVQDAGIPAYRFNLAGAMSNLATSVEDTDGERAGKLYEEALQLIAGLMRDFPGSREYFFRHSIIAHNLASIYQAGGHHEDSVKVLREYYRVAHQLHERWPEVLEYEAAYATAASHLARALIGLGEKDEAKPLLTTAEPILARFASNGPQAKFEHLTARRCIARLLQDDDPSAAIEQLTAVVAEFRELGQAHPAVSVIRENQALVCFDVVESMSLGTNLGPDEQSSRSQPFMDEGVKLFRQLQKEHGASRVLGLLRPCADSRSLNGHEAFRHLVDDLRGEGKD
jgi:eukaryotic-like serine/threonine-protein kinase